MKSYPPSALALAVEAHLEWLATTRQPGTMYIYERAARRWLAFLAGHFPDVLRLSELRRDPHMAVTDRDIPRRFSQIEFASFQQVFHILFRRRSRQAFSS